MGAKRAPKRSQKHKKIGPKLDQKIDLVLDRFFIGFWVIVAPIHFHQQPPENIFLLVVTHGFNMVAVLTEHKAILQADIWKPILYTVVYNLFLAIYVGGGGRSISGKLPYWYAQYDRPIGWVFAALATTAVTVVHLSLIHI